MATGSGRSPKAPPINSMALKPLVDCKPGGVELIRYRSS
jgi:hypothetical protein